MQRSSGRNRDAVVVATEVAGTVVDHPAVGIVSVTTEIDDDVVDDEDELRLVEAVRVEVVDFVVVVVEGKVVDVEVAGTEGIVGVSGVQAG